MKPPLHIMMIAGEASGDLHAAHLIHALKELNPSIKFSGLGGPKMREEGMSVDYDLTQIAVVGFWEVLKHYGKIKATFDLFLQRVRQRKPDCVVLVDYPGFNLRMAKELKKLNIKVIYYISPQVWAWKESRVKQIKRDIDRMLVLFSFEKDFYAKRGVDVSFVGHPLADIVRPDTSKEKFLQSLGMLDYRMTVGLLPGSRVKEVERHLPVMLESSSILFKEFPMMQFLIMKAPTIEQSLIDELLEFYPPKFPFKVIDDQTYNAINASDVCMVTSGTATLETAVLNKPMVVIYKTSPLTYFLAKLFVKIPDIGLVNIVAGKRVAPECIQTEATAEKIARELKDIFTNEIKIADIKDALRKVKTALGESGASQRAAQEILRSLS